VYLSVVAPLYVDNSLSVAILQNPNPSRLLWLRRVRTVPVAVVKGLCLWMPPPTPPRVDRVTSGTPSAAPHAHS